MKDLSCYLNLLFITALLTYFILKKIRKRKAEKKEKLERIEAEKKNIQTVLENSQSLEKLFADLALISNEILAGGDLAYKIRKRFHIRNQDIYRFIKISSLINSLELEKREIIFQILVEALLKRPSYTLGSLVSRSILESEFEARNLLLDILETSAGYSYCREAYESAIKYLGKYLQKEKSLSPSMRLRLESEIKKIKRLI